MDALDISGELLATGGQWRIDISYPHISQELGDFGAQRLSSLLRYQVSLRSQGLIPGRMNMEARRQVGYDPYHKVYYVGDPTLEDWEFRSNIVDFHTLLDQPLEILIGSDELRDLGGDSWEVTVKILIDNLPRDSAFRRWFTLLGSGRIIAFGTINLEDE